MGKLQGADHKTVAELGNDKSLLQGTDKIYDITKSKTLKEALDNGDYTVNNLVALTDTVISTPSDEDVLEYESSSSKWKNKPFTKAIENLSNVAIDTLADGEVLKYNVSTSKWENQPDDSGGGTTSEVVLLDINQVAHGFTGITAVYHNGTDWQKAKSDTESTNAAGTAIVGDVDNFTFFQIGRIQSIGHGLTVGVFHYVSDATAGTLTTTEPVLTTSFSHPLIFPLDANTLLFHNYRPRSLEASTGTGTGRKNYVTNGEFETDSSGIVSTSGALVKSDNTTTPLGGTRSVLFTGTNVNIGAQIQIDLDTIDRTDQHSLLQMEMAYTYDGPEDVWSIRLWDNTNSKYLNSRLGFLKAGTFRNHIDFIQTSPDSVDYVLMLTDTVGGLTYNLEVDRIVVTPDVQQSGTSESVLFQGIESVNQPAQTGITTFVFGTTTFTSSGIAIDNFGNYNSSTGVYTFNRKFQGLIGGGLHATGVIDDNLYEIQIVKNFSGTAETVSKVRLRGASTGAQMFVAPLKYAEFEQGDTLEFRFNNAGVAISIGGNDRDYFTIIESGSGGSGLSGGSILAKMKYSHAAVTMVAGVKVAFTSTTNGYDNLGMWDGDTGTIKESGYYSFYSKTLLDGVTEAVGKFLGLIVYVSTNGGASYSARLKPQYERANVNSSVSYDPSVDGTTYLNAGDKFQIWPESNFVSALTTINSVSQNTIEVNQLPDTSNGIAPEQVKLFCKYNSSTIQSFNDGNYVAFENKDPDIQSHNIMNIAGDELTLPKTTYYELEAFVFTDVVAAAVNNYAAMVIEIEGIEKDWFALHKYETSTAVSVNVNGVVKFFGRKGDIVKIVAHEDLSNALSTSGQSILNHMTIKEV